MAHFPIEFEWEIAHMCKNSCSTILQSCVRLVLQACALLVVVVALYSVVVLFFFKQGPSLIKCGVHSNTVICQFL